MKQGSKIYPNTLRPHFITLYENRQWRELLDEFNRYQLSPNKLEYCCGIDYVKFWSKLYVSEWKKDTKKSSVNFTE